MKKTILIGSLTLLTLLSCKKKESSTTETSNTTTTGTTTGSPTSTAVLVYTEGGTTTSVDSTKAQLYTTNEVGGPRTRKIDVFAFKSGKQVLELHFLPKTGDQTVGQIFNGAWLTFLTNNGNSFPGDYYECSSGNFNLSTCDTVNLSISGTFNFTGSNGSASKTISSGSINALKLKKN
jgi:hypothetical protein